MDRGAAADRRAPSAVLLDTVRTLL